MYISHKHLLMFYVDLMEDCQVDFPTLLVVIQLVSFDKIVPNFNGIIYMS
jgi:hypothetical protein